MENEGFGKTESLLQIVGYWFGANHTVGGCAVQRTERRQVLSRECN